MFNRVLRIAQVGIAFAAAAHSSSLIVNGGFEDGSNGWTITDPHSNQSTVVLCNGTPGSFAHSGGCYVWGRQTEGSGYAATVTQTAIPVLADNLYTLSFYLVNFPDSSRKPGATVDNRLDVVWNNRALETVARVPVSEAYTRYTSAVNDRQGDAAWPARIQLNNPSGALMPEDAGSATPEPPTVSTGIGVFLLAVGVMGRRSRKQSEVDRN